MHLPGQLGVRTLLGHLTVPFIICDVALLQFRASRSHIWMVGQSGQCGGDTGSPQFFRRIHLLEHFQLATVRNGVPADLGVLPAGMRHAFQFLQYLIMYLIYVPKPRLSHSDIDEPGVFINIGDVPAETAYLNLRIAVFLQYGVPSVYLSCILGTIISIAQLRILGLMSARNAVGILSLFAVVLDANGECDPGKGAKNDLAVMDMCFLLLVQAEHPPVAVGEKI